MTAPGIKRVVYDKVEQDPVVRPEQADKLQADIKAAREEGP